MTKPCVLHVTTTDMSLALLLGPQLIAFRDAGYEVVTCSAPGPYVAQLTAAGIKHIALRHSTRANDWKADVRTFNELLSVIRQVQPEIVHTHNPKPGVMGRIAARVCGVPAIVNTVHGLYAQRTDRLMRRVTVYVAERIAASCSDAELVQNPEDLETLVALHVPRRKLVLLGNGIDLRRFSPNRVNHAEREALRAEFGASSTDIVVGAVGRLVWEKGYRELFSAAASWAAAASPIRLVVVGPRDDSKRDAVDEMTIDEQRARGVRFVGERSDMERVYAAFDIYVLASYREGFPRSAMEAAAMGLPVVATDIRGCRQVVDDGVTGLLVPPRDSVALTGAVLRLSASVRDRTAMGKAAQEKARREFDQQRIIDITTATYSRLVRTRRTLTIAEGEVQLRLARPSEASTIAALHCSELRTGFLTTLGYRFLTKLYRRIALSRDAFVIVASTESFPVAGFVAGTTNTRALYRRFMARDGIAAATLALPHLLRSPRRALETLRYGSGPASHSTLPAAELLSIAVDPRARHRGIGEALVRACRDELMSRGVGAGRVVVDAANEKAIRLYRRCEYRDVDRFELHPGTRSVVLVWP